MSDTNNFIGAKSEATASPNLTPEAFFRLSHLAPRDLARHPSVIRIGQMDAMDIVAYFAQFFEQEAPSSSNTKSRQAEEVMLRDIVGFMTGVAQLERLSFPNAYHDNHEGKKVYVAIFNHVANLCSLAEREPVIKKLLGRQAVNGLEKLLDKRNKCVKTGVFYDDAKDIKDAALPLLENDLPACIARLESVWMSKVPSRELLANEAPVREAKTDAALLPDRTSWLRRLVAR